MLKFIDKIDSWLLRVAGWLLNILLVPLSMLYSILNTKIDLGEFSLSPTKVVYYMWIANNGQIKFSDRTVSLACTGVRIFKTNPLASAVALILLFVPILAVGGFKLLYEVIRDKSSKQSQEEPIDPVVDPATATPPVSEADRK